MPPSRAEKTVSVLSTGEHHLKVTAGKHLLHVGPGGDPFWSRMAFSVLISNTDDHLRNHGFLQEDGDIWNLAPAFDLNPNPEPGPKYLSTALDYEDTRASIDTLLQVAE